MNIDKQEDFQTIVVPAGKLDVLRFKREERLSPELWVTQWVEAPTWNREYYRVYAWKGGWAYSRPEHPQLGRCEGQEDALDEAMDRCAEDFQKVARLQRWHRYMTLFEPPPDPGSYVILDGTN